MVHRRLAPRALLVFLGLLAPRAPAGVLIVDAANGPGTDFVALADALFAAQDGDVVLVRAGLYDAPHTVFNKGVSIVADEGHHVVLHPSAPAGFGEPILKILGTVPSPMVVRGLELSRDDGPLAATLIVPATTNGAGHVFLEDCAIPASTSTGIALTGMATVTLTRCAVHGADGKAVVVGPGVTQAIDNAPAVRAGGGAAAIFACTLEGGDGAPAGIYGLTPVAFPGRTGAPGVEFQNFGGQPQWISDSVLTGGLGGDGAMPAGNCLAPGNGGHGGATLFGGNVTLVQFTGVGGLPGLPAPGCAGTGLPGLPFAAEFLGQPPALLPHQPGRAIARATAREHTPASVTLEGPSGHMAALILGATPAALSSPLLGGRLDVTPDVVVPLGVLPPSGVLTLDGVVPELGPGVASRFVWFQAITQDPASGRTTLGAPSAMLLLDGSL